MAVGAAANLAPLEVEEIFDSLAQLRSALLELEIHGVEGGGRRPARLLNASEARRIALWGGFGGLSERWRPADTKELWWRRT